MPRFVFETATSLDGFLADEQHSLTWLFAVPHDDVDPGAIIHGMGAVAMGSTTYEWLLAHEQILEHPEKWDEYFAGRPTFVFSSRELPIPRDADVRLRNATAGEVVAELLEAAGELDVWVMGGGDLAGQFDDAGALDRLQLTVAPVTLGAGAPLLPRRIESDRLTLTGVEQQGQFARLSYDVARPAH